MYKMSRRELLAFVLALPFAVAMKIPRARELKKEPSNLVVLGGWMFIKDDFVDMSRDTR